MAELNFQRAKAAFQEVLACTPEARSACLDQACGGDADLRREVEELLAAYESAGGFLSSPVGLEPGEPD